MSSFYTGSHILLPLVDYVGLSVDKINFIVCQCIAIGLGGLFQTYFPVKPKESNNNRYIVTTVVGVVLCVFCFGYQIFHLFAQAFLCLSVLHFYDLEKSRHIICIIALLYLSFCHLLRQYFDYGGYTLDITGPLMIQTQRLSSLAFSIYDGQVYAKDKSKLTTGQKQHHIKEFPNPLQICSYLFHFQGIILGPFLFFSDFKHIMEGTWPSAEDSPQYNKELLDKALTNGNHLLETHARSRLFVLARWLAFFTFTGLMTPMFPIDFVKSDIFVYEYNFFYKWVYITVACFFVRQQYYFAWTLSNISFVRSGFGFSGFHPKTKEPEFNLSQNFDFFKVEMGTSMKVMLDSWNMSTARWLRECIYERAPSKYATAVVFAVSAFWHGFYPGYYLLFVSAAFCTQVARLVRRKMRPLFQTSPVVSIAYDVITGLAAMTTLNYGATAFVILEMGPAVTFWWNMYFFVHVIGVVLLVTLTFYRPPRAPAPAPT